MTTYLLRLNLDIKEKNIKDQLRFKLAAGSIKSLSKKTNKIVILSHLGRPRGKDSRLSLKPFVRPLTSATAKKIKFISHFHFPKIKNEINRAPGGSVFLLENLRFLPGEKKNSKTLAKQLANLGDQYINNDFADSHRADASISAITKFLPSQKGLILKNEIRILKKMRDNPRHPFIFILGGGPKMKDKIIIMKYLLPKADYVLLGSYALKPQLMKNLKLLLKNRKVIIPKDWQTERGKILDIGPETISLYTEIIGQAKTIIWNGPMGYFENKKFAVGTERVAKAILKNKEAQIVVGGVETTSAFFRVSPRQFRVSPRFWVSTGGGAMLEFLADKKLPGILALNQKKRNERQRRPN